MEAKDPIDRLRGIYNPNQTDFQNIPNSQDRLDRLTDMRQRMAGENEAIQNQQKQITTLKKFFKSRLGMATLAFILVILILYILNPPITQGKRKSHFEMGSQDGWKVLFVSIATFLVVFFSQNIVNLWKKNVSKKG